MAKGPTIEAKDAVLVTGAAGFIGRVLTRKLLRRAGLVRILVRQTSDYRKLVELGAELVFGDIRDPDGFKGALQGIHTVYNLAVPRRAKMASSGNVAHRAGDRSVVVDGALKLATVAAGAGVARFVQVSSAGVFGAAARDNPNEDVPPRPDRPYRRVRLEAETLLRALSEKTRMPLAIARITHVYGPHDTSMQNAFRLIARNNFVLMGDGSQIHHISYVEDVAEALIAVSDTARPCGSLYILGSDPMVLWDWLQLIACSTGGTVRRRAAIAPILRTVSAVYDVLGRPLANHTNLSKKLDFHVRRLVLDISKSKLDLDLPPQVSPADAVQRTAEWYKRNGLL